MRPVRLLTVLLLLASSAALVAAPSNPTPDKILEAYRAQESLGAALPLVERAIESRRRQIKATKAQADAILVLARRIYPPKNLYDVFKVAYAKKLAPDAVKPVYDWLNTPAGVKLRQAYTGAYAASESERTLYYEKTGKAALKPNRKNAIETLMTTSKQRHLYGVWMTGADTAALRAFNAILPEAKRLPATKIDTDLSTRAAQYKMQKPDYFIPFNTYLFKDMKNEEIDQVTGLAATPFGEAHAKAFEEALRSTLDSAAATLVNQLKKPPQD